MLKLQMESVLLRNTLHGNTLHISNYVHAGHDDEITLTLLLAVTKGLSSQPGESRMSSRLSSAQSGLPQQVHFHKSTSIPLRQVSLTKVEC